MEFHHIGIAVSSIEEAKFAYQKIGYNVSQELIDPIQNVQLCFLKKENSPLLELVCPLDEKSPVNGILKKVNSTPYHTCYEVNDIKLEVKKLKKDRYIQVSEIVPAIAFSNRLVCFLYNKNIGIVELLNKK